MLDETAPTTTPSESPEVGRFYSAEAASALERFQGSNLLAAGKINLIGLHALQRELGTRWANRQDQIREHVERTLSRHVGAHGYVLRISEVDFVVVQPELSRGAGQALCFTYLRELLTYFLGAANECDLVVSQVGKITADGIEAVPLDALSISGPEGSAAGSVSRSGIAEDGAEIDSDADPGDEVEGGLARPWSPFVSVSGVELRVSARLEPLVELKNLRKIGYRLVRKVCRVDNDCELTMEERAALPRPDTLRIDLATIARGVDRLEATTDRMEPTLIIPVSYITLSGQYGRQEVLDLLKDARRHVRQGLICEVTDVANVPQTALLNATSLLRPFVLRIVACLPGPPARSPETLAGAGFNAAGFELPREVMSEEAFSAVLTTAVRLLKPISRSVMVMGMDTPRGMALAAAAGATHASWAPQTAA